MKKPLFFSVKRRGKVIVLESRETAGFIFKSTATGLENWNIQAIEIFLEIEVSLKKWAPFWGM